MTADPIAPRSVSNWTTATSSVVTGRSCPLSAVPPANARRPSLFTRSGTCAHALRPPRDETGAPVTDDEVRKFQQRRATVAERPGRAAEICLDAPIVVV